MTLSRKIILFILVAGFSLFQSISVFNFYGVKPNFVLVLLVVLSIFINVFSVFLTLLLLSVIVGVNIFLFSWPSFILVALGLVSFFSIKRLPWHANINAVVGVVLYSIAFSVLVNPSLFFSNFSNTIIELLYNIIIGFVFFIIFAKVFDYENRSLRAVMRAK